MSSEALMKRSRIGLLIAHILVTAVLIVQMAGEASAIQRRPGGSSSQGATCGCLCYGKTGWCKASTSKEGKCSCTKDSVYPCSGTCTQEKIKE